MNTAAPVGFSVSTTSGEDLFTSVQTPAAEPLEQSLKLVIQFGQAVVPGQQIKIQESAQSPEVIRKEYFPFLEKVDFIEEIKRRHV